MLEVPKTEVAIEQDAARNPVIGVWSTTTRPTLRNADGTAAAGLTQVSRLGQPLVNEVVVPAGLKDAFNSISPDQDAAAADGAVVDRVLEPEVPAAHPGDLRRRRRRRHPGTTSSRSSSTGIVTNEKVDVDGDPATQNPIDVDLNSQALNAERRQFQPSEMLRLNMSITGPTGLDGKPWRRPAGSASSVATSRASRTAAGSPTTCVDIEILRARGHLRRRERAR